MTYATKLLEECTSFIKRTGIPVDQFCKMVKIHRQSFYPWMNGNSTPRKATLNRIEKFLSSKRALDLLNRDEKYVTISEAVRQTGQKYDKITSLCKDGIVDAVRSLGNHWLVNIEDLKEYVATKLPDNTYFECSPNDQCLAFGSLHSDFNSMWKPLLSAHNDFEIFDLGRHEYLNQFWVSNKGEVFNATKCHLIDSNKDTDGYIKVNLPKAEGRDTPYLHRIVAYLFCPNAKYKDEVHHINVNPNDNRASNLIWVTDYEHRKLHKLWDTDKKAYWRYVNQIRRENKW